MIYLKDTTGLVPGLNALRFFSALFVIFLHLGSYDFAKKYGLQDLEIYISGTNGVYIFYVISRFFITNLSIDEIRRSGRFNYKLFLFKRTLRIFPLYYLGLFAIYLLSQFGITESNLTSWKYAIFYGYNFVPRSDYNGLIGSFHTLATEEQFYLIFGYILCVTYSGICHGKYQRLKFTLLASIAFLYLFLSYLLHPYLLKYQDEYFVNRWLIFSAQPIVIGCMAAAIRTKLANYIFRAISRNIYILRSIHIILVTISLYLYYDYAHTKSLHTLSLSIAILLIDLYLFRLTKIAAILQNSLLEYLGTISYGLYVWQSVIITTGPEDRWIASPYFSVILVFVAAYLSYEFFEKHFLKYKTKF